MADLVYRSAKLSKYFSGALSSRFCATSKSNKCIYLGNALIHHFHITVGHNAPCLPPKFCTTFLLFNFCWDNRYIHYYSLLALFRTIWYLSHHSNVILCNPGWVYLHSPKTCTKSEESPLNCFIKIQHLNGPYSKECDFFGVYFTQNT